MSSDPAESDDSPENKRKHPRTPLSLLVQFRCNSFDDFLAEYAINLSPGGMFIHTEEPREMGAMIYLQFSLADGSKLIEGLGRVVHVNPPQDKTRTPGMGVEFVNFDEESAALIEQICAQKQGAPRS